jgi:hypothetical protein
VLTGMFLAVLGAWAVLVASRSWWPVAIAAGALLLVGAKRMRATRSTRVLRGVVAVLGLLAVVSGLLHVLG